MSFNMRYDNPDDSLNNWMYRSARVAHAVEGCDADIVGAQELLHNQYAELQVLLSDYASVGVARDDGDEAGEYNPVFYKYERFELLDNGTFWLSATPDVAGSHGWDGACKRIATWAVLRERTTGNELLVMNTHLDHVGDTARLEGVALLRERIERLRAGRPVVLTGDFNSTPDAEPIRRLLADGTLRHARDLVAEPGGTPWSFHDFGRLPEERRTLIDYVFVGRCEALSYTVLPDTLEAGYLSDHAPVLARIRFRNETE